MRTARKSGRRWGRVAATAAVIGTATLGLAGNAFAGTVTWQNAATGLQLQSAGVVDKGAGNNLYTSSSDVEPCSTWLNPCPNEDSAHWTDIKNADGSWTEHSNYDSYALGENACLDSNANWGSYGAAYTHTCNGGTWQNWYEIDTTTGWALEDQQTGLFLDGGNGPGGNGQFSGVNVYTNSNYGNADHYQRWH